ncbi:peptide ABC transporter substrate-binding protein [Kineococcus sp. SYSU DK005]|uniref:peptide ABC transporter substrate-binding protein n=1 Tax=Kineococcus sp. SYSU DK005 TaxID=3383126 RepID=UPI003D7DB8DD
MASLRNHPRRALSALLLVGALGLTACTGGSVQDSAAGAEATGQALEGGTASYALPANSTPNWILPLITSGKTATYNTSVRIALWTPLYSYTAESGQLGVDLKGSLASAEPTWSQDGLTATITLNEQSWSGGAAVTSRDVEFWFNLVKANTASWAPYVRGNFPDNVSTFTAIDDKTFSLTFDQAYNQQWVNANQLTLMYALPQQVWDKTAADAAVGDYDRDPAGAQQVWTYLTEQAADLETYATNPLWKSVNGPFTLKEFTSTGQVTLAKNPDYTGPDAAHLDEVRFLPFTSEDAAFNAVLSGDVDYGYMPIASLSQKPRIEQAGYRVENWNGWAINFAPYNFNDADAGPLFKQDYIRQAIQKSVDQENISSVIWKDTAVPTYGPIPQTEAAADYLSQQQKENAYAFDTTAAQELLTEHGWSIGSDGIATCTSPGTAQDQCGEGIGAGKRLEFEMYSQSGSTETDNMMQELQSSLAKAGVAMSIRTAPLNTVLADSKQCAPGAQCSWQSSFFGARGAWYLQAYPVTDRQFSTAGTGNFGSYSNTRTDQLESAARTSNDPAALQAVSQQLATDLPVIWLPEPVYQVSAIDRKLQGVSQDPLAVVHPQRWYQTQ